MVSVSGSIDDLSSLGFGDVGDKEEASVESESAALGNRRRSIDINTPHHIIIVLLEGILLVLGGHLVGELADEVLVSYVLRLIFAVLGVISKACRSCRVCLSSLSW